MMRILLIACLAVSGCARIRVHEDPADPDDAWLVLEARRQGHHRAGCEFKVSRDGRTLARAVSGNDAPVVLAHLEPGRYEVRVTHRKIGRATTAVVIRRGAAAVVTVDIGPSTFLKDVATVVVGIVAAIGLATAYVVVVVLLALW